MPRDVSLSDSKCWNGGHEWVKHLSQVHVVGGLVETQSSAVVQVHGELGREALHKKYKLLFYNKLIHFLSQINFFFYKLIYLVQVHGEHSKEALQEKRKFILNCYSSKQGCLV